MPGQKRKREVEEKPVQLGDAALQRKISGKLHHSFKQATQAAKKAKAFEVQRTVKKLKEAKEKGSGDVPLLEKKLEMAKELDHSTLARISLARKILKIRTLAIHPMVQSSLTEAAVPSIDTIPGDIKYTVLSSKILAGEVGRLCTELKELVEPPVEKEEAQNEKGDEGEEDREGVDDEGDGEGEEEWKGVAGSDGDGTDSSGSRPDSAALQSALSKLGIELDGPQPDHSSSSSSDGDSIVLDEDEEEFDDQASWESGSVDSEGNIRRAASPSGSSSGSSAPPAKRTKNKVESAANTGAGSRFLPSLASGFIRGDSDGSDVEDADAAPERKNRRGQRARKAIWEKKYGKNANHVRKAREEVVSSRGRGRGRGRGGFTVGAGRGGAASGPGRGEKGSSRGGGYSGAPRGRGGRVRPPPVQLPTTQDGGWQQRPAAKVDEKPMHPSWIAKQNLKAREALGGVPARGKKIVF